MRRHQPVQRPCRDSLHESCALFGDRECVDPETIGTKPIRLTSYCSSFEAAGIPKGVFQVLTGAGDTGALLAKHMRIRKVNLRPFPWVEIF